MSDDWLVPTARMVGTTAERMNEAQLPSGNGPTWSRGLIDLAIGLSPVGTLDTHEALRHLERDVLDRWRAALLDGDASRVGQLVEIGHAVREALRVVPPGLRGDLLS